MSQIKQFKDFGISVVHKSFTGDKISIDEVLNQPITVYEHVIKESRFKDKGNGKCLYMQITYLNKKRVLFTGSANLMDMIIKVDKQNYPFITVIKKENKQLLFT